MVTYANTTPAALMEGIPYAVAVPLTPTEADLFGGTGAVALDPVPVEAGQSIVAVVKVWLSGHVAANNSYVFLQTDLGDGTWVDVAWCRFTQTDQDAGNPAVFVLCGGGLGTMNNAFQQRRAGAAPAVQGSGSNAVPLGGRVRFSGFAGLSGGSSSVQGTSTGPLASITYRLQHPR